MLRWLCVVLTLMMTLAYATTEDLYQKLVITDQQENDIRRLITILANTSTMGLMFKKGELEKIGKRTYGIHPLRYLGFIYADSELKTCMPKLLSKSVVATRFTKEIAEGLNERLDKGELIQYIPGFATSLHLQETQVMPYVDTRDWKGMLDFLNHP